MADQGTRGVERKTIDPEDRLALSALLDARLRDGAGEKTILEDLGRSSAIVRSQVIGALLRRELDPEKYPVLRVTKMMEEQLTFALENAIQPHEGEAPLPSREAIIASVIRELTPERAREILQFHEAKLVLTPITSMERYREELNTASQTMEGSRESHFTPFAQNQLNTQAAQAQVEGNRIKGWKFAIAEGAQTFVVPKWDNRRARHRQRIERFNQRFEQSHMSRLDYQSYIALMIQGLRQGKPIDSLKGQITLLNETDVEQGLVGAAYWGQYGLRVYLGLEELGFIHAAARFRPAVMGDIEI